MHMYYIIFSRITSKVLHAQKKKKKCCKGGLVCSACVSALESGLNMYSCTAAVVTSCSSIILDHTTLLGMTRPTLPLSNANVQLSPEI